MPAAQERDPVKLVERTKPCAWKLPAGTPLGSDISLTLQVTYPKDASDQALLPVVLFFSGFLTSASWYQQTADDVAAAGYAVVQYDGPPPWWASPLLDQFGLRYPMVTELSKEGAL